MARGSRTVEKGAIYHITQRGNNKDFIFEDDRHKGFLIKQIKEYNAKLDFNLLAYVIMGNHYHLLIKTNNDPISSIMFYLNNTVGKYLGRELNRTGHIFQGRFKSRLVDNDAYLIWLVRYIHRNPLKANICSSVDDYKWSSHKYYISGSSSFVNSNFVLGLISENKSLAVNKYLELVNTNEMNSEHLTDYECIKQIFNLSSNPIFCERVETIKFERKTITAILDSFNFGSQINELIKSGSRKRLLAPYKVIFIKASLYHKYTLTEIGDFMSVSQSALSKFIIRHSIK